MGPGLEEMEMEAEEQDKSHWEEMGVEVEQQDNRSPLSPILSGTPTRTLKSSQSTQHSMAPKPPKGN
jgi:hypothetical protein